MAVLSGAVEADVPIQFADQEWTEFMFRSLYGSYAKGFEDVAASLSETDADSGDVTFETEGDRLVRGIGRARVHAATRRRRGRGGRRGTGAPRPRPREVPHLPSAALRAGELPHGLRRGHVFGAV